jgi:hypothetical protein
MRLRKTVDRLWQALPVAHTPPALNDGDEVLGHTLARWHDILNAASAATAASAAPPPRTRTPLLLLPVGDAGGGTALLMPIDEVLCFEAADNYVRVLKPTFNPALETGSTRLKTFTSASR